MEIFQLFDLTWSLFSSPPFALPLGTFASQHNSSKNLQPTEGFKANIDFAALLAITTILAWMHSALLAAVKTNAPPFTRRLLRYLSVIKACHSCTVKIFLLYPLRFRWFFSHRRRNWCVFYVNIFPSRSVTTHFNRNKWDTALNRTVLCQQNDPGPAILFSNNWQTSQIDPNNKLTIINKQVVTSSLFFPGFSSPAAGKWYQSSLLS